VNREPEYDWNLLPSQRAEVFTVVQDSGFLPSAFEWRETEGHFFGVGGISVPMLVHRQSAFYFKFGFRDDWNRERLGHSRHLRAGGFCVAWAPAIDTNEGAAGYIRWDIVPHLVREWLGFVRRETQQVDPWSAFGRLRLPRSPDDTPNEPFTQLEQQRIAAALDAVAQEAEKRTDVSPEQFRALQGALEEIKESTTRLGRKDWVMAFMGNWIWWVVSTGVQSQAFHGLIDVVSAKLSFVWSALPHLLRGN
jgi:hypothetical protein